MSLQSTSKYMSLILRHKPEVIRIRVKENRGLTILLILLTTLIVCSLVCSWQPIACLFNVSGHLLRPTASLPIPAQMT